MTETLQFIFGSVWRFLGVLILLEIVCETAIKVAFNLRRINQPPRSPSPRPESTEP